MPRTIIYDQSARVCEWVQERLEMGEEFVFPKAIGLEEDGVLIAGVLYDLYTKASINMHVAADEKNYWISKSFLRASFGYPFHQLKCHRVTALVRADNARSRRLTEHLGWKQEGLIRMGNADGTDVVLYGMLKNECRWLEI